MNFTVPTYKSMKTETKALQQTFNRLSSRYIPPEYPELRIKVEGLVKQYEKKVSEKKGWFGRGGYVPDKTRLDQIACITQLEGSLPEKSNDEGKILQSKAILLGALFYRYLRIDDSYAGPLGFFSTAEESSALIFVLKELLTIDEVKNKLDPLTVSTCCEAYREYLKQNGVSENYSYIKKDTDFFKKLDEIIDKNAEESVHMLEQINTIMFVQSVGTILENNDVALNLAIDELIKVMAQSEKMKQQKSMTTADILDCLKTVKMPPNVEYTLRYLIPDEFILQDDKIEGADGFKNILNKRNECNNQYILIGAYLLGLSLSTNKTPHLCNALKNGINIQLKNQLDFDTKDFAYSAFDSFMSFPDLTNLNTKVWNGIKPLQSQLTKFRVELAQQDAVKTNNSKPNETVSMSF